MGQRAQRAGILLALAIAALGFVPCQGAEVGGVPSYALSFHLTDSEHLPRRSEPSSLPSDLERTAYGLGCFDGIRCRGPLSGELHLQLGKKTEDGRTLRGSTFVPFEDGVGVRAKAVRLEGKPLRELPTCLDAGWRVSETKPPLLTHDGRGLRIPLCYTGQRFGRDEIPAGLYRITFQLRAKLAFDDGSTQFLDCTAEPSTFFVRPGGRDATYFNAWGRLLWSCLQHDMMPRPEILAMAREWVRDTRQSGANSEFSFIGTVYRELAPADETYQLYCHEHECSPRTFWQSVERKRFRQVCKAAGPDCPVDPPLAYPREWEDWLNQAYRDGSREGLIELFDAWSQRVSPLAAAQLAQEPELVRDTYAIFREFFTPFSLRRLGKKLREGNPDTRFVIVQESVAVEVQAKGRNIRSAVVRDFRPQLQDMPAKPLLKALECQELIHNFLDLGYALGQDLSRPGRTDEQRRETRKQWTKRVAFLSQAIRAEPEHWGGGVRVTTDPFVYRVVFTSPRGRATVHFQVGAWGGEAEFAVVGGKWQMKGSRLTSIQ